MLAGMLAAMVWYARPQLAYSLSVLRLAVEWVLRAASG
jgi:hypothetical protein